MKREEIPLNPEIQLILDNYQRACDYHSRNFSNSMENWRIYSAKNPELGLGQYPSEVVDTILQQGRQFTTYNFTTPTIDAIAASLIQAEFDPEFLPAEGDVRPITHALKKVFYADKEDMAWKSSFYELIKHGLIHEGVIKMVISNQYSPLGNIGFEVCIPGSVVFDPCWKTLSTKDCRVCWKESWLTALDLIEMYPKKAAQLELYVENERRYGVTYGDDTGIMPFITHLRNNNRWGSLYRVVEQYEVKKIKVINNYVTTMLGEEVQIPSDVPDEDRVDWLDANIGQWSPELVEEREETEKKSYVSSICEALIKDQYLENGLTEVQVQRVPFLVWSASRDNGEPHSIVEAVKDVQYNINYAGAMIVHKLQTEGGGGAQYYDPDMFETPAEAQRWAKNRNQPIANFKLKKGYIAKGIAPAIPVQKSPFPREAYEHLNILIDKIWPHVSKITPSTFARPEPGNETSGKLFQLLKIQSDNLLFTIHYSLKLLYKDIYEMYLLQAAQTYSNELIPRSFNYKGENVEINNPIELQNGQVIIENNFSDLKNIRHKVIISEVQESPNDRMYNLAILSEYQSRIHPSQIGTLAIVNTEIARNIDQFSEEASENIAAVGALELKVAFSTLEVQLLNNEVQKKQLSAALQQPQQLQNPEEISETPSPEGSPENKQASEPQAKMLPEATSVLPGGENG